MNLWKMKHLTEVLVSAVSEHYNRQVRVGMLLQLEMGIAANKSESV
jgi:hypothetical protein